MTDQEALDAFVKKHGWVWQPGDHYKTAQWQTDHVIYDNRQANYFNGKSGLSLILPAGLWIEGRLLGLLRHHTWKIEVEVGQVDANVVCYGGPFSIGLQLGRKFNRNSLIQALIAALEAVEAGAKMELEAKK